MSEKSAPAIQYSLRQIAKELIATALGKCYCGNALYVARDLPGLEDDERWVIDRWLEGDQCGTDHIRLQEIAHKIAVDVPEPSDAIVQPKRESADSARIRLANAAPEMLAILRDCEANMVISTVRDMARLDRIRDAISKATGE